METSSEEIVEQFEQLGLNETSDDLLLAIDQGTRGESFGRIVASLSDQLNALYGLEENVQVPKKDQSSDDEFFLLELSALIKELDCPHEELVSGPLQERFGTPQLRSRLLVFLMKHLKSARVYAVRRSKKTNVKENDDSHATILKNLMQSLNVQQHKNDTGTKQVLAIRHKLEERLGSKDIKAPLFAQKSFTTGQWTALQPYFEFLNEDYHNRAVLLLKRLDMTIGSFLWSDRIKQMEDQVLSIYRPLREAMGIGLGIHPHDLLAARTDILLMEKTSSASVREKSRTKLNKILMSGRMPDRGGRPEEHRVPALEMPAWKKNRTPDQRGGGGFGRVQRGGHRGGHRGGGHSAEMEVVNEYEQHYVSRDASRGTGRGGYRGRRRGNGY